MPSSKKTITAVIVVPLILAGLGIGGYMLYERVQSQTEKNNSELERFGYEITGSSRSMETVGVLGATQLPATFDQGVISPTQKVINGLIRDKNDLLTDNKTLQEQIQQLQVKVSELIEYKNLNEYFAPQQLKDELRTVERQLKAYLIRNPDAQRFSTLQIEIMSAAGAAEYKAYIIRNRLMLSADKKQSVISNYLPAYAFCVGYAIDLAANSRGEERKLANFFRTENGDSLTEDLFQDLSTVLTPCQNSIREKLENDNI